MRKREEDRLSISETKFCFLKIFANAVFASPCTQIVYFFDNKEQTKQLPCFAGVFKSNSLVSLDN